jgi:hypothetical protein
VFRPLSTPAFIHTSDGRGAGGVTSHGLSRSPSRPGRRAFQRRSRPSRSAARAKADARAGHAVGRKRLSWEWLSRPRTPERTAPATPPRAWNTGSRNITDETKHGPEHRARWSRIAQSRAGGPQAGRRRRGHQPALTAHDREQSAARRSYPGWESYPGGPEPLAAPFGSNIRR